jgi:hypothetical protein
MECSWDEIFDLYEKNKQYRNRKMFIKALSKEFLLVKRNTVEEVESQDGYKLYLIDEEKGNEKTYYDA